jgi:CRISPR-associated protein Cmr5
VLVEVCVPYDFILLGITMFKSRSQNFSKAVWEKLSGMSDTSPGAKDYGRMAHQLPILIRKAGLAQAIAFAESKTVSDKEITPERKMLNHFAQIVSSGETKDIGLFSNQVRNANLSEYMHLTQKSLEVCAWFKRFAQSKLGVQPNEEAVHNDSSP